MHIFAYQNKLEIVEYLLIIPSIDILLLDRNGGSALELVAKKGHYKVMQAFLRNLLCEFGGCANKVV